MASRGSAERGSTWASARARCAYASGDTAGAASQRLCVVVRQPDQPDFADRGNLLDRVDGALERRGRTGLLVDVHHPNRAGFVAAEREIRDVHADAAEDGPDFADHARLIV